MKNISCVSQSMYTSKPVVKLLETKYLIHIFNNITEMKTKHECRICLKDGGNVPIFGDEDKPDISLEVAMFGSIQIKKDDEFPKSICRECYKLLDSAISFRKAALHADVVLQRRRRKGQSSQTTIIKLEDADEHQKFATVDVPKPDFLNVNETENITYIKNEESSDELLYEDDNKDGFDYDDKTAIETDSGSKKNESENFKCTTCSKVFKSLEEYEDHEMTISHKKNCSLSRKRKSKIKVEKKPAIVRDQKCEECNKFFTQSTYKKHLKVVHNIRPHHPTKTKECPVCKKLFRPDYLARHKRVIHGVQVVKPELKPTGPVECPVCKKMLARRYFNTHMRIHDKTNSKKFICDQCGKEFGFQSAFINHRAIHSNDLPYKCDYCPYRGRSKHLLRIHTRTHTGDYPFKCTQCNVRCITKSNLNRHMQRHTGPVDFLCDSCNRGFYSKLELERHITATHLGIKSHVCNICGVAFGYRQGLMKHQRKVHKRAKGVGRAKATYLKLQEEELLQQSAGLN